MGGMRSGVLIIATLVGCGGVAPAPRPVVAADPPRPQHHVQVAAPTRAPADDDELPPPLTGEVSVALVAGGWHGSDDDRWQYDLDIGTDATFTQVVHQDGEHDCQQTGTVATGAAEILRTFRDNECNHDYDGKTVHDRVITLDDAHMVLQMESDYLIRYDRAP